MVWRRQRKTGKTVMAPKTVMSRKRIILSAGVAAALATAGLAGAASARSEASGMDAKAAVERAARHVTAGETLAAVEALREAALSVWSAAPFDIARLDLSTEAAQRYRAYETRADAAFARGQAIHLYVEPVGMAYEYEKGRYSMRLKGDFLIEDTAGRILGGQKDFADVPYTFPVPATEVYMTVSLGTASLPPGDYVINMTFRDPLGQAQASRRVSFSVVAAEE